MRQYRNIPSSLQDDMRQEVELAKLEGKRNPVSAARWRLEHEEAKWDLMRFDGMWELLVDYEMVKRRF
jgi:hypothetical protein